MDMVDDIVDWAKDNLLCETYGQDCPERNSGFCKCNNIIVLITEIEYLRPLSRRQRETIVQLQAEIIILKNALKKCFCNCKKPCQIMKCPNLIAREALQETE